MKTKGDQLTRFFCKKLDARLSAGYIQPMEIEPIPMRPVGYFANVYTKAEIREDNRLAKASVVRTPKDLE